MASHAARWSPPFAPVQLREMWTYTDGAHPVKAYRQPPGPARAGTWVLVDQQTGNVAGTAGADEFARRFRPVDEFADVPALSGYLGTVTGTDGAPLVDLVLDRNPFMLANGPGRVARPHVLMVPRLHRDGWSSATPAELAARQSAMRMVAAWYATLDGGRAVFAANDSGPNLDYRPDADHARAAGHDPGSPVTRNPRQDVQRAHLHAFFAEAGPTENHESPAPDGRAAVAEGRGAFGDSLGGDAVAVGRDTAVLAAGLVAAARPWGGSYCSYQPGADGPGWVMPALGAAQDEFNRRLAAADGLRAEPDPRLGGAVNLVRPSLDDAGRRQAAQRAAAGLRASFAAFAAGRGLDRRSLPGT